ncbi:uncharacterized protein LOC108918995 [Arapaima gigas]
MPLGDELLQDRLNFLLMEMRKQLTSAPQNSASQDQPASSMASIYQTRWDADRIRYKEEKIFSIPLSWLCISAQQHRQMQRQCGSSPLSVTSHISSAYSEYEEDNCQLDSDLERDFLVDPRKQKMVPTNPWDVFAPALEFTTSSVEGSPRCEKDKDLEAAESFGEWMHHSYIYAFDPEEMQFSTGSAISTLRPFSLVATNPTLSLYPGLSIYSDSKDYLLHPLRPCPLQHSTTVWKQEMDVDGEQERQEDILRRKSRSLRRQQGAEVDVGLAFSEGGVGPRKKFAKFTNPVLSLAGPEEATEDQVSDQHVLNAVKSCPDGTYFSDSYKTKLWQAFTLIRIPDDVVRWAVGYLLHTTPPEDMSYTTPKGKEGGNSLA